MSNNFKCTPRQARTFMVEILEAGLVPFLQGSPGIGKSAITQGIARDANLELIDHRLSTSEPTDMNGFPDKGVNGKATFLPFDIFPLEGDPLPPGKNGWFIFLEELNSVLSKSVEAAGYKFILDRMIGQKRLHERAVIAASGNLKTDRAIVSNLSTAMQSRLIHLELEVNFQEWLEDVAIPHNYDPRILGYLMQYPGDLMDFRPDHKDKTFSCPRTWEFTNRMIRGKQLRDDHIIPLSGTISPGVAMKFVQFTKVYNNLVSIDEVLKDPENSRMPLDTPTKWATITMLFEHVKDQTFQKLTAYADRFDLSFRILFYRTILARNPALQSHPYFSQAVAKLNQYLNS